MSADLLREYIIALQDLTIQLQAVKILIRAPDANAQHEISRLQQELAESESLRESERVMHESYVKTRLYEREILLTHSYKEMLIEELVSMTPHDFEAARKRIDERASSTPGTRRESLMPIKFHGSGSSTGSPLNFQLNDLLSLGASPATRRLVPLTGESPEPHSLRELGDRGPSGPPPERRDSVSKVHPPPKRPPTPGSRGSAPATPRGGASRFKA